MKMIALMPSLRNSEGTSSGAGEIVDYCVYLPSSSTSQRPGCCIDSTAAVDRAYGCSLQASSRFSSKGSLVDPRLRASNEGLPRPRVARAGG